MATIISNIKRGKPLHAQSREIVYNVYKYFIKEANKFKMFKDDDGSHYFKKVQERVASATGISRKTLNNILNEVDTETSSSSFMFNTPKKGRPKKECRLDVNDLNYDVVRKMDVTSSHEPMKTAEVTVKEEKIEDGDTAADFPEHGTGILHEADIKQECVRDTSAYSRHVGDSTIDPRRKRVYTREHKETAEVMVKREKAEDEDIASHFPYEIEFAQDTSADFRYVSNNPTDTNIQTHSSCKIFNNELTTVKSSQEQSNDSKFKFCSDFHIKEEIVEEDTAPVFSAFILKKQA